jgi:hypothetical protein
LRRSRAARLVGRFFLHEFGVRQDDAELIVQLVKKLPKFLRLIHGAPLEQICDGIRETIHSISGRFDD